MHRLLRARHAGWGQQEKGKEQAQPLSLPGTVFPIDPCAALSRGHGRAGRAARQGAGTGFWGAVIRSSLANAADSVHPPAPTFSAICAGFVAAAITLATVGRASSREKASCTSEAYQFDWNHEVVLIGGMTVTVKVAHLRLCHSQMLFAGTYPRETQEIMFDAHDKGFTFFKSTCTRGIYHNMKTAEDTIFVGRERAYNRRFLQMCSHYLVDPVACA